MNSVSNGYAKQVISRRFYNRATWLTDHWQQISFFGDDGTPDRSMPHTLPVDLVAPLAIHSLNPLRLFGAAGGTTRFREYFAMLVAHSAGGCANARLTAAISSVTENGLMRNAAR